MSNASANSPQSPSFENNKSEFAKKIIEKLVPAGQSFPTRVELGKLSPSATPGRGQGQSIGQGV